jgi:hypothetical protein
MSIRAFKHFISKFEKDTYRSNKCQIVSKGQTFKGLYYIASIAEGYEVHLRDDDNSFKVLRPGSWAGIIEIWDFEARKKESKDPQVLWGISLEVAFKPNKKEEKRPDQIGDFLDCVVAYHIDLKVIVINLESL